LTYDIIYFMSIGSMKFDTMLNVRFMSRTLKGPHRAASTLASRRAQLLQKKPDDVVITFAKRTAMGRSKKGQLKDVPVDELLHALFKVRVVTHLTALVGVDRVLTISGYSGENQIEPGID
jgi:hypothetical protein